MSLEGDKKYEHAIRNTHKLIGKVGDMRIWEKKSKGLAIKKALDKKK